MLLDTVWNAAQAQLRPRVGSQMSADVVLPAVRKAAKTEESSQGIIAVGAPEAQRRCAHICR